MPETNQKDPFNFDSLADIHDDIQADSSEVNVDAVQAHNAKEAAKLTPENATAKPFSISTDSMGVSFDPEKHATDSEGNPSLTPTGKFRKKRKTAKSVVAQQSIEAQKQQELIAVRKQQEATASLMVDTVTNSLAIMIGPEWKAEPDESVTLKSSTTAVLIDKDIKDFPPMAALVAVTFAYASKRVVEGEQTQTKIGRVKGWMQEKYITWKNRKRKNASQSDSGDDGKREDNTSEKAVQTEQEPTTRYARP